MSDTKNILLAWVSAGTTLLSNVSDGLMPLVSAVVLPIIFFAAGKTIDVLVQVYLNQRRKPADDRDGESRGVSAPSAHPQRPKR